MPSDYLPYRDDLTGVGFAIAHPLLDCAHSVKDGGMVFPAKSPGDVGKRQIGGFPREEHCHLPRVRDPARPVVRNQLRRCQSVVLRHSIFDEADPAKITAAHAENADRRVDCL